MLFLEIHNCNVVIVSISLLTEIRNDSTTTTLC